MGINISQQALMFLYALLLGGVMGTVYDAFRVTRIAFRLSWAIILLEDLLFFFISSVLLWRYFLEQSNGEVRIFAVLGVLLGWLIYFFTLGNLVMQLSGFIIDVITKVVMAILVPVGKICSVIKKYLCGILKLIKLGKNRLKSRIYLLYNKSKRPRKHKDHKGKG